MPSNLLSFQRVVRAATGKATIFQQDNAPIHTARVTREWLEVEKKIKTMDWPANSPDLNPIENIWKLLKDKVQKRKVFPRTVAELKTALKEEWEAFDVSIIENIVASMPRRIEAVLKAKGGPTKY